MDGSKINRCVLPRVGQRYPNPDPNPHADDYHGEYHNDCNHDSSPHSAVSPRALLLPFAYFIRLLVTPVARRYALGILRSMKDFLVMD